MSLDDYVRKYLENAPKDSQDGIQELWASHLTAGQDFLRRGLFREAIVEYTKEHIRPIKSKADANIVQTSYWLEGRAYKKLGELENAIEALQKARELLKRYEVGSSPHEDLVEIFIEQGRFDDAIEMCQEELKHAPSWGAKQLLAKAIAMKGNQSE